MKTVGVSAIFFLISRVIISCEIDKSKEVGAAMEDYTIQMAAQNPDSIAALYAINGEISGKDQKRIIGKDSIRKMFNSFSGFSVLRFTTLPSLTTLTGDSARQEGSYKQIVVVPSGDTLKLNGKYTAVLVLENGHWRIRRMYTFDYGKF
jgi:hypothetical protein